MALLKHFLAILYCKNNTHKWNNVHQMLMILGKNFKHKKLWIFDIFIFV